MVLDISKLSFRNGGGGETTKSTYTKGGCVSSICVCTREEGGGVKLEPFWSICTN